MILLPDRLCKNREAKYLVVLIQGKGKGFGEPRKQVHVRVRGREAPRSGGSRAAAKGCRDPGLEELCQRQRSAAQPPAARAELDGGETV